MGVPEFGSLAPRVRELSSGELASQRARDNAHMQEEAAIGAVDPMLSLLLVFSPLILRIGVRVVYQPLAGTHLEHVRRCALPIRIFRTRSC